MIQVKVGSLYYLPVRLLDSTGTPVTGKLYSDITATAYFNDGTNTSVSPAAGNFPEYSGGAYALKYTIPNKVGPLTIVFVCSGANDFVGVYDIVADLASDVVSLIGSPATGTIGGAIAQVKSDTGTILTDVTTLLNDVGTTATAIADIHNMEFGRWQIVTTGPDSNRLVAYRTSGTLPIASITGTFTAGNVCVGATSGARGTIVFTTSVSPVTLIDVVGTFQSGEVINDAVTPGSATTTAGITSINTNILQKFNLLDSGGSPTTTNPFQRVPTP